MINHLSGDKCMSCYVEVLSFSDYPICNTNKQGFFRRNLPVCRAEGRLTFFVGIEYGCWFCSEYVLQFSCERRGKSVVAVRF
jgi:hypothetical protein